MSAGLLRHPGKMHTLTDDLESFLHVLGWITLRFLPAIGTYDDHDRSYDMRPFDEHYKPCGSSDKGGGGKRTLVLSGEYPSDEFQPREETPLSDLFMELSSPFKSLYTTRPPTAEERKKVDISFDLSNRELRKLSLAIEQYDQDMGCLESSTWFIATMKTSLAGEGWPEADKANDELPIHYGGTKVQDQNMAERCQRTQNLCEDSKGLRNTLKRTRVRHPSVVRSVNVVPPLRLELGSDLCWSCCLFLYAVL